jgi:hypothetical protein
MPTVLVFSKNWTDDSIGIGVSAFAIPVSETHENHAAIRQWLRAIFVYFLPFNKDGRDTQSSW